MMKLTGPEKLLGVLLGIILILISIPGCATLDESKEKEAESHYKMAISHLKDEEYQPAFVELQKTIRLNPKDKRAYYALGIVYHYFEDYKKSAASLQKAISIDPKYSSAYNLLGLVSLKEGKYAEAVESFKKALQNPLYENPEKAYANLGKVYYRMGEFKKALSAYKKAAKRAPDNPVPYYGIALCYNALGRFGDASDAMKEAVRLDPEIRGDPTRAEEIFTKKKLSATEEAEEQDYIDFLDILHY